MSLVLRKHSPINVYSDAIVVVSSSHQVATQNLLEMCKVKMKLDIVGIPDQDYMGTADTLRYIKDKIKVHFQIFLIFGFKLKK